MLQITIGETEVLLFDYEPGQGKIIIANPTRNYSYYWGSMGCSLSEFICHIDSHYFAKNLTNNMRSFSNEKTFKSVRKFLREEMDLPWYKHTEFQKDMRMVLKEFQAACDSEYYFVNLWDSMFINRLDYDLISGLDHFQIQNDFKAITEHWNFIEKEDSQEFKWICELHRKLKTELTK